MVEEINKELLEFKLDTLTTNVKEVSVNLKSLQEIVIKQQEQINHLSKPVFNETITKYIIRAVVIIITLVGGGAAVTNLDTIKNLL